VHVGAINASACVRLLHERCCISLQIPVVNVRVSIHGVSVMRFRHVWSVEWRYEHKKKMFQHPRGTCDEVPACVVGGMAL